MSGIKTWFLNGVSGSSAPTTLEEARGMAIGRVFDAATLLGEAKWDYLIREGRSEVRPGFVELRELATTRRGMATGANGFFLVSAEFARSKGLERFVDCVGKAADVRGFDFAHQDLATLRDRGRGVCLVSFSGRLTPAEIDYVAEGEASGVHERYICASRTPWHAMERGRQAPIWAAVFGRKGMRFIHNGAGAHNLTTFHGVYPKISGVEFAEALTLCLNTPSVQEAARAQTRVYGGGLLKFEPRDLLAIKAPDLSRASPQTVAALAAEHRAISGVVRHGFDVEDVSWERAESLVAQAAEEAANT